MPKRIEFSVSSLVDLKSELFKKQLDLSKKKTVQTGLTESLDFVSKKALFDKKKSNLHAAKANKKSIISKSEADFDDEERKLQLSKDRLIQKSALYEKLSSGSVNSDQLDGDGKSMYLVDFERKTYENGHESDDDSEHGGAASETHSLTENSEEDWTDYVDSFGRTRRCLKKDLPDFVAVDEKISTLADSQPSTSNEHSSSGFTNHQTFSETKSGPVHYQNVLQDEIRDHGAAFYRFSSDEVERQKQMKHLEELSKQTAERRRISDVLKQKRRQQMQTRLAKVKERKKLTVDIDLDDETSDLAGTEKVDLADILLPGEEDKQAEAIKTKNEQLELKRAQHVRPWDKGKRQFYTQDEWLEKQRKKRYSDFAPPSTYISKS